MDGWSWILRGLWVGDHGSWEIYGWVIMDLERSMGGWSWILRGLWVGDRGSWEVYGWVIVAKLPISLTLSGGGSRIYQKITPTKEVCAQPTNQIWQIACKKLHSMTEIGPRKGRYSRGLLGSTNADSRSTHRNTTVLVTRETIRRFRRCIWM